MIRIYPSRLDGEALEVHQHGQTTVHEWLRSMVQGYIGEGTQPIQIDIDGVTVPPERWLVAKISAQSDVRIYPVPNAAGAAAVVYWVIVVLVAAYAIYVLNNMPDANQDGTGSQLSLNSARANSARLGDPIREILGRRRVYPDYLVPPVSRFIDGGTYQTKMLLAVGMGDFVIPPGEIRIGETPIGLFGADAAYTVYAPGADVGVDERSENWFSSPEVGGTKAGTAGLDTKETANADVGVTADSVTVSGNTVSFNNLSFGSLETPQLQDIWDVGQVVELQVAATYQAETPGLYSVVSGPAVDELVPFVGMPVTLVFNDSEYSLFVASYTAGHAAVPGVGGSAASIVGSAAVSSYNFSASSLTFTLTWKGVPKVVLLDQNYGTMAALVTAISSALSGTGLEAAASGSILRIREIASPWQGGSITYSLLPPALFGGSPVITAGLASTGGTPAADPRVTFAYDSEVGTAFSGLPAGALSLALSYGRGAYRVESLSGDTATVARLKADGATDPTWLGWFDRTSLDYAANSFVSNDAWLGPFLACPDGELTDAIELDFSLPQGLARYNSKGKKRVMTITLSAEYRLFNSGSAWTPIYLTYSDATIDAKGYTHRINLPEPSQVEVRVRRVSAMEGGSARESLYWQGMRARMLTRPTSYAGLTTVAVTINTGSKLSSQSDRRFNMVATRQYTDGTARTISGAIYHVLKSVGFTAEEIDYQAIDHLEQMFWTPRGEFFDYVADKDGGSALDILKTITQAGGGYFLLSEGMCSAGREGIKSWTGGITPQETTDALQVSFKAPSLDDFDGVDVTFVDGVSWANETVQCRLSGATPRKVESVTIDGVLNRRTAWRLGMRRLLKYQHQRLTFSCATELDAMVYNFGDRLVLTDDIPGSLTTSCLIEDAKEDGSELVIAVPEDLDWSVGAPRCLIRFQDGTLSPLLTPTHAGDRRLRVDAEHLVFEDWILGDPTIEPPRLIFCSSEQIGYDAVVTEITPNGDGTVSVAASEYNPLFYAYDDASEP